MLCSQTASMTAGSLQRESGESYVSQEFFKVEGGGGGGGEARLHGCRKIICIIVDLNLRMHSSKIFALQ